MTDYNAKKYAKLRKVLKSRGLNTKGTKPVLVARLEEDNASKEQDAAQDASQDAAQDASQDAGETKETKETKSNYVDGHICGEMQSTITLPDKTAFQWLLLNLLCHDFQHDYSEPGKRTSKLKGQIVAEVDLLLSNYYVLKNGEDDAEKFQEFQEDFEQVEGHAFKGG